MRVSCQVSAYWRWRPRPGGDRASHTQTLEAALGALAETARTCLALRADRAPEGLDETSADGVALRPRSESGWQVGVARDRGGPDFVAGPVGDGQDDRLDAAGVLG